MFEVRRRQSLRLQVPPRGKMLIDGFARFRLGMAPTIRAFVDILDYDLSWWLLLLRSGPVHWQVFSKVSTLCHAVKFLSTTAPDQHGMHDTYNTVSMENPRVHVL